MCLGTREESLDWKGHVKCHEDVNVLSFNASSVHVKVRRFARCASFGRLNHGQHFMSLVLTPPEPRTSPFIELNINIPIKFVSDSYSEAG